MTRVACVKLFALVLLPIPISAQDFDNTGFADTWNAQATEPAPGPGPAFGHVIRTDAANPLLREFSFWIGFGQLGGPLALRARVAKIESANQVGQPNRTVREDLWESRIIHLPRLPRWGVVSTQNSLDAFFRLNVKLGHGLHLDDAALHVAFLEPLAGSVSWAVTNQLGPPLPPAFPPANGNGWILNASWSGGFFDGDSPAFAADFEPVSVPEPGAFLLLATGIVTLVGLRRFGKKHRRTG